MCLYAPRPSLNLHLRTNVLIQPQNVPPVPYEPSENHCNIAVCSPPPLWSIWEPLYHRSLLPAPSMINLRTTVPPQFAPRPLYDQSENHCTTAVCSPPPLHMNQSENQCTIAVCFPTPLWTNLSTIVPSHSLLPTPSMNQFENCAEQVVTNSWSQTVYTTVYVYVVGIGTPPPHLPQASVPPPPEPKGGDAHSPAGEGVGGVPFPTTRESLALCPLCGVHCFQPAFAKRDKK